MKSTAKLGFPNYKVAYTGEVYNTKGKEIKHDYNIKGYKRVTLYHEGESKRFLHHRLIALLYIPNPHGKPQVNHLDGDIWHNLPPNLEWCTAQENVLHAIELRRKELAEGCPF